MISTVSGGVGSCNVQYGTSLVLFLSPSLPLFLLSFLFSFDTFDGLFVFGAALLLPLLLLPVVVVVVPFFDDDELDDDGDFGAGTFFADDDDDDDDVGGDLGALA
jgi:hypothetical protein